MPTKIFVALTKSHLVKSAEGEYTVKHAIPHVVGPLSNRITLNPWAEVDEAYGKSLVESKPDHFVIVDGKNLPTTEGYEVNEPATAQHLADVLKTLSKPQQQRLYQIANAMLAGKEITIDGEKAEKKTKPTDDK